MKRTVIDLFCGTGGFSHGFAQTGEFEVVFGLDILPSSVSTFSANHRTALGLCKDIREVRVRKVAEQLMRSQVDVIIGGPPCQGFSSIRPFRSINEDDRRNTLFEHMMVFVEFFRPRFVVFENVVGLLNHKNGRTIETVKQRIGSVGYAANVEVLNAVHYGVPQKRERVFVIARKGVRKPFFPEPTHAYNGRSMAPGRSFGSLPLFSNHLPPALTLIDAISDLPNVTADGESASHYRDDVEPNDYQLARRNGATTLTLHSSTRHTPRMLEIIRKAGTNRWALPDGMTTSGFSSCYSRLTPHEPSTTITVNFVHPASNRCIHPYQDRALTPREGARIQSFDDDFTFCGSRTEIVKQIGEAVPPLLGRAVAQSLLQQW